MTRTSTKYIILHIPTLRRSYSTYKSIDRAKQYLMREFLAEGPKYLGTIYGNVFYFRSLKRSEDEVPVTVNEFMVMKYA